MRFYFLIEISHCDREREEPRSFLDPAAIMNAVVKYMRLLAIMQMVASSAFAQTFEAQSGSVSPESIAESKMSIKDLLFRDFGFDLPISGSFPELGMRTNPIVIHSTDAAKIVETMYLTVHGMNLGLGAALAGASSSEVPIGVLWQPHPEQWIDYHPKETLYSVRFERKKLLEDEIDTQSVRFYFRLSDYDGTFAPNLDGIDVPSVSHGGIRLPVAISSLHYAPEKTVDYAKEKDRPDLGVGFAYEAVGVKGTVYIFPVPTGMAAGDDTLRRVFEQSASDVEAVNQDISAWPDANDTSGFKEREWMMGKDAEKATVLGIGIVHRHFVKYRLTWVRDRVLDQVAAQFMRSLKRIVVNP